MSTWAASSSAVCSSRRSRFSASSRPVWIARPISCATASRSAISSDDQRRAFARWAEKTPIVRSPTITGVATAAREPSAIRCSRPSSACSASRSSIATVRRSEAASSETGRRSTDVAGSSPSRRHSRSTSAAPRSSASRTKHRSASSAAAVSAVAMSSTEATSRSERRRFESAASSRSRSSASESAVPERSRSSAIAASATSSRASAISSRLNARGVVVVATLRTPITVSSTTSGTSSALRAPPIRSARRRLVAGEDATSKRLTGAASKTALAMPEGSPSRSMTTSSHGSSRPSFVAATPRAMRPSTRTSDAKSTSSSSLARSTRLRPSSPTVRAPGSSSANAHDRLPPPLRLRPPLLRLAGAARAREQELALAEAREEEDGRERADDRRGECEPAAAADRLAVDEDGHAHEHGGDADRREDQREGQLERRGAGRRSRQALGASVAAASR